MSLKTEERATFDRLTNEQRLFLINNGYVRWVTDEHCTYAYFTDKAWDALMIRTTPAGYAWRLDDLNLLMGVNKEPLPPRLQNNR